MIHRPPAPQTAPQARPQTRPAARSGRAAVIAAGLLAVAALPACREAEPSHGTLESEPSAAGPMLADHAYTVRGQITQMPADDQPMKIYHEDIPNFMNGKNERKGMNAMPMPFRLRDGVSADGLEVGSIVVFSFEVTWENGRVPSWEITRITPLPADTQLDFNTARPTPNDDNTTDTGG